MNKRRALTPEELAENIKLHKAFFNLIPKGTKIYHRTLDARYRSKELIRLYVAAYDEDSDKIEVQDITFRYLQLTNEGLTENKSLGISGIVCDQGDSNGAQLVNDIGRLLYNDGYYYREEEMQV